MEGLGELALPNLDSLKKEYETNSSQLERFRSALHDQITELAKDTQLALGVALESRVKGFVSLIEKSERTSKPLNSVFHSKDLVGLRIILLFKKDIEKVKDLIKETFLVMDEEDTGDRLGENQFGYRSFHYQVKVKPEWTKVPSFSGLGNLEAEIQVRTVAQHIWAAASHQLQYKQESIIPNAIRRSIHRVSALLETVDLEFERVLLERDKYMSSVSIIPDDQILNIDILEKYLDANLPSANKKVNERESYPELISNLAHVKIIKLKQLSDLWNKHKEKALRDDSKMVEKIRRKPDSNKNSARVASGVYFSHTGLIRKVITFEYRVTFGSEIRIA